MPRVLVAGAGPSGATAALMLARQGIPVTLIERHERPFEDPRAATIHPPTLELYAESGVTEALLARGIVAPIWHFRGRAEGVVAAFDLGVLADETPYPYRLQCEQHKLVAILLEKLAAFAHAEVRWGETIEQVTQDAEGVTARLASGEELRGAWIVGADGGRSVVRKSQAIGFEGFTYPERFLVVTTTHDFARDGYAVTNYVSDPDAWCALFNVPGEGPPGRWRVTSAGDPEASEAELLDHAAAQRRLERFFPGLGPFEVIHTNLYVVHQRVASVFRHGRVLLAGDAAHVNNPLGGMGMNFGVHDAANLAEKLGRVWRGEADENVLDRFDRQRRHVAQAFLQAMTIANKQNLEERDAGKRAERLALMRETGRDRDKMRAYLMKTSMIEGFRAAAAIT
jgi:3-(3-hydroxy-phenyl)propionate hydroxylase